jgi:hypothetical protein
VAVRYRCVPHAVVGAKAGTATVFDWKGETLPEYWRGTGQLRTEPGADGCGLLVDTMRNFGGGWDRVLPPPGTRSTLAPRPTLN